jgi:RND family efflux transporter MFP subunit
MWLILAVAVIGIALAIWQFPTFFGKANDTQSKAATIPVAKVTFAHSVIEPGEIESSNNTDIRCEVQARNTSGVMIIEIVPNGTVVKPGDFLVQFDSSALENEKSQQQIVCNNAQAMLAQSKAAYETAVITKQEYLEGTSKQEEQTIQSEVFVAEENLRRAQEYAGYSERLAARGYVTGVQVEADRFAVEKARKELETAQTKLRVLREYTRAKMIKTLDANIESALAKQQADENSYKLEQSKLALIETQIAKCRVVSPVAGKVVYANQSGGRGSSEVIIQEGTLIRERQSVIRIPDMQNMQVTAKINETRVGFIREGMEATVRLDAFPDLEMKGRVTRVDDLPIPSSYFSAQVKQYNTYVHIDNPPAGLIRPGLTAKVEIHVEKIPDTIAVPVVSVIEHSGEFYCFVKENGTVVPRWVAIGSSNDTSVVIREGLQPGDELVENPDPFAKVSEFPAPPAGKTSLQNPILLAKRNGENPASGPAGEKPPGGKPEPAQIVKALFEKYDANGDNMLEGDEIPAEQRERLVRSDANGDGKLDKAELLRGMQRRKPAEATADASGAGSGPAFGPPGNGAGPGGSGPGGSGPPNLTPPGGMPRDAGPGPRTSMLPAAGGAGQ